MATRTKRKAEAKGRTGSTGSTSQGEHPLNTIFNLASILRVNYPADAEQYRKAGDTLQAVRQDNVGPKFIHNAQHARNELRELCMGWRADLGRLALLVLQHLPTVAMEHPVLNASPRHWHDTPAKEWGGLLAALRAVEVATVQEANAKPGKKPLTDRQQEALEYIKCHGPKSGKEVCSALGIPSESSFTRHYVPALKAYGVKNRLGAGYYFSE